MQQIQYIRHELSDLYTTSEISVLTRIILEEVLGESYQLLADDKINHLSLTEMEKMNDILKRLKKGEPYQYVLGEAEFYGRKFKVTPDVLIPRPETEELVEWIVSDANDSGSHYLDIGTGSGCIAVTLAKEIANAQVDAWDISENALAVAKENAHGHKAQVNFSQVDILQPMRLSNRYDIIVSNPPYITEAEKNEMSRNVLDFEPHVALFVPDSRPLIFYEHIADLARVLLNDGGRLYFEINREMADALTNLLSSKGFQSVEVRNDISGNPRMVRALKPVIHV
jgi:release factor glutamine methyltransferase